MGSGFSPLPNHDGTTTWRRGGADGDGRERQGGFVVRGREVERSVVTGRTGEEVLRDEGVEGFVGRGGWRGVVD